MTAPGSHVTTAIEANYRDESRRVLATLVRLLGDFDLAEEALHEAFLRAVERWDRDGIPANPSAWLVSTGRFSAIDALRRRARFNELLSEHAEEIEAQDADLPAGDGMDDHLRLVFLCCHPDLPPDGQVALTLREVCGLTTEEIAAAYLTSAPTIAQRIVRAKARIREARLPKESPSPTEFPVRLDAVLHVIYLVFNEGYAASSGESLTRPDLSREAIRLCRLLCDLIVDAEALGLLALMLLHEARRMARTGEDGDLVVLDRQDRTRWNQAMIDEGKALLERALAMRRIGPYSLQAAIAAVHADSADPAATDWPQIVGLYDLLVRADPSPVVALNRAVAVAMRDGPAAGLALIDDLMSSGSLQAYPTAYVARAELLRRLARVDEARASFEKARLLVRQAPQRRYIERALSELDRIGPSAETRVAQSD